MKKFKQWKWWQKVLAGYCLILALCTLLGAVLPFNKAPKGKDAVLLLCKSDATVPGSGCGVRLLSNFKEIRSGHMGNLVILANGDMTVYEYGRYDHKMDYITFGYVNQGRCLRRHVGNAHRIPGGVKPDGRYDYSVLLDYIVNNPRLMTCKGCIDAVVNEHADASRCTAWWEHFAYDKQREAYSFLGNNCASAAQRAFDSTLYKHVKSGSKGDNNWMPYICEGMTFKYWTNLRTRRVSSNVQQKLTLNDFLGVLNGLFPTFTGVLSSDYSWLNVLVVK